MNAVKNPEFSRRGRSYRTRLSWGIVLVVAFSAAIIMAYTFYRTSLTNDFLADQVNNQVLALTEHELGNAAEGHADNLEIFFDSAGEGISTLGAVVQSLLIEESAAVEGTGWDARTKLSRLPQGSWDNANEDTGSIFVPAREQLSDVMVAELNTIKRLDLFAPSVKNKNPDMIALYFGSLEGETLYYPNIDLANLLPPDFDVTKRPWFNDAAPLQNPKRGVAWSEPYVDAALNGLVVTASYPVYGTDDRFRGVIAADFQLVKIAEHISSIRFTKSGYAFLLDKKGRVIAMPSEAYADFGLTAADLQDEEGMKSIIKAVDIKDIDIFEVLTKMTSAQTGIRRASMNGVDKYIAYRPIPSVGYSLGIVVPVSEMQGTVIATRQRMEKETSATHINVLTTAVVLLAVALLVSRAIGNALARPLTQLTETATRLAEGDLSVETPVRSNDEFGLLANAFNVMAARLRETIGSLEERVAERTAELAQTSALSEKRATELKAVSDVARAISTESDFEKLLDLITNLVSLEFGFYHVGVFLIDHVNNQAVLRSANSPGGKRMMERGHALAIGQVGIVGNVASTAAPRIALDVGRDATFFNNPDLPETRSEMALPLRLRGQAIGVLDVQSRQQNAFTQADVETLTILADQIAIAIENARLLAESKQALVESQMLYGEYIGSAWERKTNWKATGYHYVPGSGRALEEPVEWDEAQSAVRSGRVTISEREDSTLAIAVPIRLQNQVIGVLDIRSTELTREWSEDEIAMLEAIADRLALALENARLFEETSGRAAREHAVAEITTRIRETNDPQVMIRTAIEELQRVLKVSRVEIIPQVVSAHLPGREAGQQAAP
ncbi:MAG: GAF domain-containing protein [Chloroflexi bacterium]|nr:GAF domain-containing protein [Chloroflexota bacterium]